MCAHSGCLQTLIGFIAFEHLLLQAVLGSNTCSCEESPTNPKVCLECTCPDGSFKAKEDCNFCACVKLAEPPIESNSVSKRRRITSE